MKNFLARFIVFALIAMNGCRSAPGGSDVEMWKIYRVVIPHFVVEFLIPPELKQGYALFRTEVSFENPEKDRFAFSLGDGRFQKAVGGFYLGARRDFSDWDLTAEIFVLKSDSRRRPMCSAEDLAKFARDILAEKYVLADGVEVDDPGSISIEKIGHYDVVIATRADPYSNRITRVKDARGNYTDQELKESPYQIYYIRLDDEVTIGIHVFHDIGNKLSPKWYAESHARIAKIIENIKVESRR